MPDSSRGGRKKNITGHSGGVQRRGSGLGTGPVGSGSGMHSGSSGSGRGYSGSNTTRGSSGGRFKLIIIAIIAIAVLGGGGGIFSSLLGGGIGSAVTGTILTSVTGNVISNGFGADMTQSVNGTSSDWVAAKNTGKLDETVSKAARDRYTTLKGSGRDVVTIMVYMCGTDLESKYGMASNDLREMMNAKIADNVNILVYTGGCKAWKSSISSTANQIYKLTSGSMTCLEKDMGSKAMTDPATLTEFIKYAAKNYPADRNMLIFWDHGGGSLSGFGYDEKFQKAGSMNLAGINTALKDAGIKYDFVGFDACLMATVETDLMLDSYADYVIASEETEPGVGWYYTNWLNDLSKNTSMPTIDIGKRIIDDFVDVCDQSCPGQKTTLSIVDLAELSQTVGDDFKAFSQSTTELIQKKKYTVVSDARTGSREFAQSSAIDQIDLVNFAYNLDTKEGKALAETLLSAVKYNRTSSNMTNAYGISIYFPYNRTNKVDSAVNTYDQIGLDEEYSECIKEFAGIQNIGSAVSQGTGNPLFSILQGSTSGSSSGQSLDSILGLISSVSGLTGGRSMSDREVAEYVSDNLLDVSKLTWKEDSEGHVYMSLAKEDWDLVQSVDLCVFVDDGEGYIDMGLDNLYDIDDYGNLIADTDGTWLSLNGRNVAYYHVDTTGDTITGRVPAYLNGERVNLIVNIDYETGEGSVAGAEPVYGDVTDTEFRGLVEIVDGDRIDLICDYYDYDGNYRDSYYLGDQIRVNGPIKVSDTYLDSEYIAMYRFTDIYGQEHWSERFR